MIVFSVLYILSVFWCRYEIIRYSKKEGMTPEMWDMLFCIIPVLNTVISLTHFLERDKFNRVREVQQSIADWFFRSRGRK